jgi:hypothetical protein
MRVRKLQRFTILLSAVVVAALPVIASAQSGAGQQGGAAQPPPRSQQPAMTGQTGQQGQDTREAALQQLTAARDALAAITQMPAASQLQGEARTAVNALITNFNALIASKEDWRSPYRQVQQTLATLLGPDPNAPQVPMTGSSDATATTGTSGTSGITLPADIKAKLTEIRTDLDRFGTLASGQPAGTAGGEGQMSGTSGTASMSSTAGTGSSNATGSMARGAFANSEDARAELDAIQAVLDRVMGAASGTPTTNSSGSSTGKPGSTTVMVSLEDLRTILAHVQQLRNNLNKQ